MNLCGIESWSVGHGHLEHRLLLFIVESAFGFFAGSVYVEAAAIDGDPLHFQRLLWLLVEHLKGLNWLVDYCVE